MSKPTFDLSAVAGAIDAGLPFARLSDQPLGEAAAYDLQDGLTAAFAIRPGWGPVAGYKIAVNGAALMARLGRTEPLWARVFAGTVRDNGAACDLGRFTNLMIEPEVALILGAAPLPSGPGGSFTPADLWAATARLVPAIELIDMRGATRETAPLDEAVAQNISNIGAVLGGPGLGGPGLAPESFDLAAMTVRVSVDGGTLAEATGAAPQDPFVAAAWLAGRLAMRGIALHPGQFVLCGTHTDMLPVRAGSRIAVEMPPLGTVEALL